MDVIGITNMLKVPTPPVPNAKMGGRRGIPFYTDALECGMVLHGTQNIGCDHIRMWEVRR